MKQTIILLMLVASQAIGQVYYSLETGVVDSGVAILNMKDKEYKWYKNNFLFYSDIMLGYEYKKIHVETNLLNIFGKGSSIYFNPKSIKYDLKVYYKYKKMKIGYEHSCTHPILNDITTYQNGLLRASHDKFFIRYEFKQ